VHATLWVDVEDLYYYASIYPRPSSIQRLAFEIYCALQAKHASSGRVRFIRHDPPRNSFRDVKWSEIVSLFQGLTATAPAPIVTPSLTVPPRSRVRRSIGKLTHWLPLELRISAAEALTAQVHALRAWKRLLGTLFDGVNQEALFAARAAPGDVLLVLGSPWSHVDYASLIDAHRQRCGLRLALLVYDLIPLRRPEWCADGLVKIFRSCFDNILPICDQIFAISKATAADVEVYAREQGIVLPRPVVPLPIGTGFSVGSTAAQRTDRLPPAGSYAMIVSTIEARKNHLLLFRVWRRLLEELPPERVPTLVFAGRVGWLVQDLMQQIANTSNLNGKLVVIENPSDAELVALYQDCLFTMYPSFYEGWGLPVTESLGFGKPCFISNCSSLPEAGGALARAFDPDNLPEAYRMIRSVVVDPAELESWEARVRQEFKPIPWSATVEALLASLHDLPNPPSRRRLR
jgi:glycosyltransferase involved in cell wall biosynthesis